MSKLKLFCYDCFKNVEPTIEKGQPNWFDSYFCPTCKGKEIARKSNKEGDTDFAIWNGREFVRRHINDN